MDFMNIAAMSVGNAPAAVGYSGRYFCNEDGYGNLRDCGY